MKLILELEIPENKMAFAEEFFKSISFVKKIRPIAPDEITDSAILNSIDSYEKGSLKPTPLSLTELKKMIHV